MPSHNIERVFDGTYPEVAMRYFHPIDLLCVCLPYAHVVFDVAGILMEITGSRARLHSSQKY